MLFSILGLLIGNTIVCGIISILIGSFIGLVIGLVRKNIDDTIYTSTIGCFLGSMIVTTFWVNISTLLEWGSAGGLASVAIIYSIVLIIFGGFVGAVFTSTLGFRVVQELTSKQMIILVAITYITMTITLYLNH